MAPHRLSRDGLRTLQAQLREEWDAAEHAIFAIDAEGEWVYSNPRFDELVGLDCQALVGKRPPFPHIPRDQSARYQALVDAWREGKLEALGVQSIAITFQNGQERRIPVLLMGRTLRDENGEVDAAVLVTLDLTQTDAESSQHATWLHARMRMLEESIQRAARALSDVGMPHSIVPLGAQALSELDELTRREREVFDALVNGNDVAGVASALHISPHTARNHLKAIFRKLGVRSQLELLRRYPAPPPPRR